MLLDAAIGKHACIEMRVEAIPRKYVESMECSPIKSLMYRYAAHAGESADFDHDVWIEQFND